MFSLKQSKDFNYYPELSDIYSLGLSFLEVISMRSLDDIKQSYKKESAANAAQLEIPKVFKNKFLAEIITRMLEVDQKNRIKYEEIEEKL